MIPSYFLKLVKIPLTPNGKVDRKSLPDPVMKTEKEYAAPRDEVEKKLTDIWAEVLGADKLHTPIGIDDNFFELGGHSLKATILMAKIHKAFDVKVSLAEMFKMPTVRGLAGYIKTSNVNKYEFLHPVEKKEYYSLSSAQKRLYILITS